ncbi:MAG: rRNA maturation RNase YbeY [Pseudomonadota bacterium]
MDLRCADEAWTVLGDTEAIVNAALGAAASVLESPAKGSVSVLLTGDGEMQALNAQWREKDLPTDVLSFPAGPETPDFLGDIAVGYGVCARDAASAGRPLAAHLTHMLVHGFLHLEGHDHREDTEASEMEALEVKALARLGLPDPYSK